MPAEEISGIPSDGAVSPVARAAEPADGQLGESGEKTLRKLREEIKALKAELAATRDAGAESGLPSDGSRGVASDADAGQVATTGNDVKPKRPRFQGTADGGARMNPAPAARQLSRADLRGLSAKQIDAARRNGQLRNLMSGRDHF
ncbi:hypothetical protein ACGFY0_03670 [Streptomyces chartreusis]|uniref:hypothetical protein n=1 Tax=Streptomyces chartreusis TaxID=1969 RepID=UPI003716C7F0